MKEEKKAKVNPFQILQKYGLMKEADDEIRKNQKKLHEPPLNMQGRNEIYCKVIGRETGKRNQQLEIIRQTECDRSNITCIVTRLEKKKDNFCNGCSKNEEIIYLEESMKELNDASKQLKEDAAFDDENK